MVVAVEGEIGEAWGAVPATLRERLAPRLTRAEPRRARAYLAGAVSHGRAQERLAAGRGGRPPTCAPARSRGWATRRYSAPTGRIEDCRVGVFLVHAAPTGCAFLDRALYLPEEWVAGDTVCGGDELRRWLWRQGRAYALALAGDLGI